MSSADRGSRNGANGVSGGDGPNGEDFKGREPSKLQTPMVVDDASDDYSTGDEDALMPLVNPILHQPLLEVPDDIVPLVNPILHQPFPEEPDDIVPQVDIVNLVAGPVNLLVNYFNQVGQEAVAAAEAGIVPGIPLGGNEVLLNWGAGGEAAVQAAAAAIAEQAAQAAAAIAEQVAQAAAEIGNQAAQEAAAAVFGGHMALAAAAALVGGQAAQAAGVGDQAAQAAAGVGGQAGGVAWLHIENMGNDEGSISL